MFSSFRISTRTSIVLVGLAFALNSIGLWDLHQRYYASEEEYAEFLQITYPELPTVDLSTARKKGCAWIAEADSVAENPPKSHFNLLQPMEVQGYFDESGCVHWCSDHEDWRWTSLSVRDRNIRLHHLYVFEPVAIVKVDGYRCLQQELVGRKNGIKIPVVSVMWDIND